MAQQLKDSGMTPGPNQTGTQKKFTLNTVVLFDPKDDQQQQYTAGGGT
jgi:hypothetical protein